MLVEDDAALRRFLEVVLSASHEVVAHPLGEPALAALGQSTPDVLVSDLMLPDVPGEEIARAALRVERSPFIVLISGDCARLERARPLADATLAKPFTVVELERIVAGLASMSRRNRDRRR
jgi:DNA-binding response OmpR family regulator